MCISLMREHNKPGLAFLYFFHDFSHLNISSFLLISSGVFTFCQGYVFKSQHKRLAKVVPFVFGSLYHSLYGHKMKAHCGYSEKP